jgi:molecular chaperone GrpE
MEKEGSAQDIWLANEAGENEEDRSPRSDDSTEGRKSRREPAEEAKVSEPGPPADSEDLSDLADPEDSDDEVAGPDVKTPGAGSPDAEEADAETSDIGIGDPTPVDEMIPAEDVADTSEKKPRRSKGKRVKKGDEPRKPSEKEVLQRLLEKNEMILQLGKKNRELEAAYNGMKEKRVQLLAEFENYRKRTRKEWDLLKGQAKAEVIVEILQVVDDFERALAALGEQDDEFVQGIKLIYNNLLATLSKFGVTKMIALGEAFDPNYHMAVASVETDEVPANHVVEVIQEGYLMNGNVIRPANVVIAK